MHGRKTWFWTGQTILSVAKPTHHAGNFLQCQIPDCAIYYEEAHTHTHRHTYVVTYITYVPTPPPPTTTISMITSTKKNSGRFVAHSDDGN